MRTLRQDPGWTEPEVLTFSQHYSAVDLAFTADGERMLFCSNRPHSGGLHPQDNYDIWWSDRQRDGTWGDPRRLGSHINTDRNEFYPSLTDDGTLYFLSSRDGGRGGSDIYRSAWLDGEFGPPENLGAVINTDRNEGDAFIARDESFLVFVSSGHQRKPDEGRLFVSFRSSDGGWSEPHNLGPETDSSDYCPTVSPDGRYFFFTGTRTQFDDSSALPSYESLMAGLAKPQNGQDDVYWVAAEFVTRLRPGEGSAAMM
jgi:Tol biopolymer transport system component